MFIIRKKEQWVRRLWILPVAIDKGLNQSQIYSFQI